MARSCNKNMLTESAVGYLFALSRVSFAAVVKCILIASPGFVKVS